MKIAPEGWVVIVPIVAIALILGGLSVIFLFWSGVPIMLAAFIVAAWSLWFFRDPNRVTPPGTDQVISPADGKVIKIDVAPLPVALREAGVDYPPMQRVSIFLNIFNVHVNRVPAAGKISKVVYSAGTFFNASMDKASESNERSAVLLTDPRGRQIAFVQIAGWVARRIVNSLREGQTVAAGERFGLIRFGSRAEIYMPQDAEILVQVGEHVIAGESLLAKLAPPKSQVETVVRTAASPVTTGASR